jgi:hypothetical protein
MIGAGSAGGSESEDEELVDEDENIGAVWKMIGEGGV